MLLSNCEKKRKGKKNNIRIFTRGGGDILMSSSSPRCSTDRQGAFLGAGPLLQV